MKNVYCLFIVCPRQRLFLSLLWSVLNDFTNKITDHCKILWWIKNAQIYKNFSKNKANFNKPSDFWYNKLVICCAYKFEYDIILVIELVAISVYD